MVAALVRESGGHFFFACKNRLQIPMITKQSCKTSDVLMGSPPLESSGGKKLPPV